MSRGRIGPEPPSGPIGPPDWRHYAACVDEDPELFFPIGSTGRLYEEQIEEAKKVCRRCVVPAECLHFALETGQEAGIWGGQTEDERRAIKRRRAAPNKAQQRGKQR